LVALVSEEDTKDKERKRILTYLRNELLSVPINEIAYIYTEHTITYVLDIHGKSYFLKQIGNLLLVFLLLKKLFVMVTIN